MKTFHIPVVWTEAGTHIVEAETEREAIEKALSWGVPDGDYIEDSLEIDYEGLEILKKMEETKDE